MTNEKTCRGSRILGSYVEIRHTTEKVPSRFDVSFRGYSQMGWEGGQNKRGPNNLRRSYLKAQFWHILEFQDDWTIFSIFSDFSEIKQLRAHKHNMLSGIKPHTFHFDIVWKSNCNTYKPE